jgi:hypothetical protein
MSTKFVSQNGADRSPVMPHHGKAAAPFRPIGRECTDEDMATRPHGPQYACRISLAVGCLRQEMKGCPIVPKIIGSQRIKSRGLRSEPRFCGGKRLFRKIKDSQIPKPFESASTSRDAPPPLSIIAPSCACYPDEIERDCRIFLIPALLPFGFGLMNTVPMGLPVLHYRLPQRPPKIALPIRTCVAPSSIAISKS